MAEFGEKTEQPTSRKLLEARNRGNVPKSQDLSGVLSLVIAGITLLIFGGFIVGRLHDLTLRSLDPRALAGRIGTGGVWDQVLLTARDAGGALLPVMAVMATGIALVNFMQVGPLLTAKPLEPKLSKLSPIAGVKRVFGRKGLVKALMNIAKLAAVVLVAFIVISMNKAELVQLAVLQPVQAAMVVGMVMAEVLVWILFLLIVIGVLDYMFQRWQHRQELKMTKQEVKDELKSMEGDPEMKRRRMQIAQGIAMQRLGQDVPQADVVVTNPTHFSVAIRYDDAWPAPKVTAKGGDHMAFRIRQLAIGSGVPIVERPPLARALYWGTEVGDEIAPDHYEAVAEILAYVYRLDGRAADERTKRQAALRPQAAGV
ncbi:MAG: flagellar biosynthesis protein FlhB [Planctomycetota bacterium]